MALEGSEWRLEAPLPSARALSTAPLSDDATSVLLMSAAAMLAADMDEFRPPPGVSLLLHGDPALIPAVSSFGLDDYLANPWTSEELLFRLRRVSVGHRLHCRHGSLSWGRYWLAATDMDSVRVSVPLTPAQFGVLDLLARYAGENVARETMLAGLPKAQRGGRSLDMHVSRLRSRIAEVTSGWPKTPRIRAERHYGYCLEIE